MSLASSPDCFLRPEDKALRMLYPSTEQPFTNTFDDFFDREMCESNDDNPIKRENSKDSLEMFSINATKEYDSINATNQPSESSPQPWRKGVWQLMVGKTRKINVTPPSSIAPAHLVVNDNFALRSPRSSSQTYDTKNRSPSRLRQLHCAMSGVEQSALRDMALSPSPMYPRSFANDTNDYTDVWPHEFQNFNLQLNDDCADAVPVSHSQLAVFPGHFSKYSKRAQMADRQTRMEQRSATMHHYGANVRHIPHHTAHELSYVLNANLNATERNTDCNDPTHSASTFRFVSEDLPDVAGWTTESLHSSNSSHNSHDSQQANMYNTIPPQNWWSPPSTHVHNHLNQGHRDSFPKLVQPQPRRVTHNVLSQDVDRDEDLSNHYQDTTEIGIAIPYHPSELQASSVHTQYHSHTDPLASYPSLPPPVGHGFSDESPFRTPRRARTPTRTPSPPVSPTHRPSRSHKQRSPSRRDASQHRRKSIHKAGPMKDAETPRHRSTSRPPRTPKTPKTPHDGFGQIGFVNFTPKDATKLLSDVAPSGSSKTRARREQEAREKRKKLSEAALNAVRNAGGDVEALERAILN